MTIDQFLEKLKPLKWTIDGQGKIRSADLKTVVSGHPCCPVAALLPPTRNPNAVTQEYIHKMIGLSEADTNQIIIAADTRGAALRGRLLEACGLPAQPR